MQPLKLRIPAAALALALMAGCAGQPPAPAADSAPAEEREVELTLNLPEPPTCDCPAPGADYTFLERGFRALAAGDSIEAVQYFQRYRRLEKNPTAAWEADVAIAYASILPNSPFYDLEAATRASAELQARQPTEQAPHDTSVLLARALEALVELARHLDDVEGSNAMLRQDLEKREQALRRLRELTLGQPATPP
ncbi:MAG TPA: hypothetical protein VJ883_07435 [Woeseiaceae bacterium]|nr:hypothetical protein [Woeseiaceae bacterium]